MMRSFELVSEYPIVSRRVFLRSFGILGAMASVDEIVPPTLVRNGAGSVGRPEVIRGSDGPIDLHIAETGIEIGGRSGRATTINGTLPGPILRFREGEDAVIHVRNELSEDTSIHWHGTLLPNEILREVAPSLGIFWEGRIGRTADLTREESRSVRELRTVVGVRMWN